MKIENDRLTPWLRRSLLLYDLDTAKTLLWAAVGGEIVAIALYCGLGRLWTLSVSTVIMIAVAIFALRKTRRLQIKLALVALEEIGGT